MALWFESSVAFDKIQGNGAVKKVTEKNLFDALSFTEAEARTIEELTPYISGDFSVKAVKKTKISEIFFDDTADKFYLVNVAFITIDEKSGVEKENISQILVQANDFDSAVAAFKDGMKGTMADWVIKSVTETLYMGVYTAKLSSDG
ncbi:DUF4494 domain-containing protein [Muribaculum sp.]|uniref:DUF4494 domain-containing protein n=1 Tax=Muribaculum sp. TaxID=1918611 RepID=UPI00258A6995|nr:DUF4494 domain-containing protein [Muribaculum sp.]MCX4278610.1 DUF4494 domain-containing protein [Muribaculum sp.]